MNCIETHPTQYVAMHPKVNVRECWEGKAVSQISYTTICGIRFGRGSYAAPSI